MLNPESYLEGFGTFQWLGTRIKDFDFRKDFGRKTGRELKRSLVEMFKIPIAVSQENIVYTIPIEKTLFPKRKRSQEQIDRSRTELEASIRARLDRTRNFGEVTHTDILISGIVEELALYKLAFGEFPLPDEVNARILKSIELYIEDHKFPSPAIASMHLILGGELTWTDQQSRVMLEDLRGKLIGELDSYQDTHAFNNGFARTALAYKVLREHTG